MRDIEHEGLALSFLIINPTNRRWIEVEVESEGLCGSMEGLSRSVSTSGATMKRLLKDIKELEEKGIDGVHVMVDEGNVTEIEAAYDGPEGTPYEGGVFRMKLYIGEDYPHAPPKGRFLTKIFHPNVSSSGDICVNVLKRDWKPDMGLLHILTVIRCLLVEPNPESALNEEAGKLLLEGFDEFASKARIMTEIHAQAVTAKKQKSVLTATGGANVLNATDGEDGKKVHHGIGDGQGKGKVAGKKPRVVDMKKKKSSLRRL